MGEGQATWKQILPVFIIFLVFLFAGAGIFKGLEDHFYDPEDPPPRRRRVDDIVHEFVQNFTTNGVPPTDAEVHDLVKQVEIAKHGRILEQVSHDNDTSYNLDYMESWYFCMTIVTTIGYGHMGPLTDAGKIFCCAFAFIGIPICLILLALVGGQLGDANRWLDKRVKEALSKKIKNPGFISIVGILVSLIVMLSVFFFIPALIFTLVEEDWTYLEALYYCFITLSTVGFGDFVAALPSSTQSYAINTIYKFVVFLWIMVGLTFLAGALDLMVTKLKDLGSKMSDLDVPNIDGVNVDMADLKLPKGFKSKMGKDIKPKEVSEWGKTGTYNGGFDTPL
ncbi:potassium channel subfamily K member 2-like [Branchiostoma lanceolatum]|uniref:potassium channel subfamily K member 2-like n=1 Tax=Branchiostoma lanceolatum TaxID=7740 RepID=UPI0034524A8A